MTWTWNQTILAMGSPENFSAFYILVNVLILLVGATTIFLNFTVIIIFHYKLKELDAINIFLYNLAIADNITGFLVLYNAIYNLILFQNFYECVLRGGLIFGIIIASSLLVFGLSSERYIKISFPFSYQNLVTDKKTRCYVAVSWIIAVIFAIVPSLSWINNAPERNTCAFFYVIRNDYIFTACSFISLLYGGHFVMYFHIFYIAISKTRSHKIGPINDGGSRASSWRAWWKPTKVLLIITGSNILTLLPTGIYMFMVADGYLDYYSLEEKGDIVVYVGAAAYLNSILNPILYAFKVPEVKRTLSSIFCCCNAKKFYSERKSRVNTLSVQQNDG